MNKKIISCMLAGVLVLGMLAIGNVSSGSQTSTGTSSMNAQETMQEAGQEEAGQEEAGQKEARQEESAQEETTRAAAAKEEIKIVYTNDIHSYIANAVKDGDTEVKGLRISKVAKMTEDMRTNGGNVILVDDGDEIQGNIYGAIDEGVSVVDIMNAAGYQLATPGNHDFDYGISKLFDIADEANFPYITCNFHYTEGDDPFESTRIFEIGGRKIAFVGITTPETITSSTPIYFQDESGNYIYKIDGTDNAEKLYTSVQKAIDSVRDDVDYVIALGHVGIEKDAQKNGISSLDVISHTTGLDAFIDGHSHTTMAGNLVQDKDGKDVLLTQTGCYLANVGIMTIGTDGKISTELISDYESEDEDVAALEDALIAEVDEVMGQKVGILDTELYINNPDKPSQRLIRSQEMNAGDIAADGVYWYFNESRKLDCDLVLQNGGGVRADVPAGDITIADIKNVQPFGNQICLIKATGQQIKDALEMGAVVTGEWDSEADAPAESGAFMQVAGLKYTVDASVPSGIQTDDNGMFVSVEGEYRVKDIQVYNKATGEYENLVPDKEYNVGGVNYILRNSGNGMSMFKDCDMVVDYVGQDYEIMLRYIESFAQEDGSARVNTANSPLASYKGYQLNYEDPYGSGRITILK